MRILWVMIVGACMENDKLEDYSQFYVGFGERLAAVLIDFFFMALLQVAIIGGLLVVSANLNNAQPQDYVEWLGLYGPLICLGVLILVAYHMIGWSLF